MQKLFSIPVWADWQEQVEVVSGAWGTGNIQFGLEKGDTIAYDHYPNLPGIMGNGDIVIDDIVNQRTQVFAGNGMFKEVFQWTEVKNPAGGSTLIKPKYKLGCRNVSMKVRHFGTCQ